MLANEVADADADTEQLRQQVEREAALVASTKAMDIKLSRAASRTLQAEMLRRVERGPLSRACRPRRRGGRQGVRWGAPMRTVFCCGMWHGISGPGRKQKFATR